MKTTVSFTYDRCWACAVNAKYGARVRILNQEVSKGVIREDVEIWSKGKKLDDVIGFLREYPYISSFALLSKAQEDRVATATIETKREGCPLYLILDDFNSRAIERIDYCGVIRWDLGLKAKELDKLKYMLKAKFGIQQVGLKRAWGRRTMSKSMFLLKEAFERGYFDVPKRISIEELSSELKVPLSTLNVNLRRALKNILREKTR